MLRLCTSLTGVLCLFAAGLSASGQTSSHSFDPHPVTPGTLRIWGNIYMTSVVLAWEERFQHYHPDVKFDTRLMGSDTGMPGLYTGLADIAILGRESNTTENDGFLHTLQYRPLELHLTSGSLDIRDKSYALVVFVQKSNPIDRITLQQFDAVMGCGQPNRLAPVRTWGELGLRGDWSDKSIHVYTFDAETGTGLFLLRKLQGESRKTNWQIVDEYRDIVLPDGSVYPSGQQTVDALDHDPYGIAISGMQYQDDQVKPLPLAATGNDSFIQVSRQTIINGSYPLARRTYAFVNQPPGKPVPPLVREFLRFVYSEEGQGLIEPSSGFLPLTKEDAEAQVELLQLDNNGRTRMMVSKPVTLEGKRAPQRY